jgi:hypothetical protein
MAASASAAAPAAAAPAPTSAPAARGKATARGAAHARHHLYSRQLIARTFTLPADSIGSPAVRELADLARELEGKCTREGLVREGSTSVPSYSAGVCVGGKITYNAQVECDICSPVPGQQINNCRVESITKVGIRAIKPPAPGPLSIFILRDHYGASPYYASLEPGDEIDIVVTAPRFQLNDTSVTVLADLIPKQPYSRSVIQPS